MQAHGVAVRCPDLLIPADHQIQPDPKTGSECFGLLGIHVTLARLTRTYGYPVAAACRLVRDIAIEEVNHAKPGQISRRRSPRQDLHPATIVRERTAALLRHPRAQDRRESHLANETFTAGRTGIAFKNGKLYQFSQTQICVLQAWPQPAAWRKTALRPAWYAFRPDIDLLRGRVRQSSQVRDRNAPAHPQRAHAPPSELQLSLALNAARESPSIPSTKEDIIGRFFATIPMEVREPISRFPARHWNLLSFAARCPGALDLLDINPALAYGLASNWIFHNPPPTSPMRAARIWVRRSQHTIAAWLGFPEGKAVGRILGKIPPPTVTVSRLLHLRRTIREQDPKTLKLLAHLPAINAGVIRIVTDDRLSLIASPQLLREISADLANVSVPATAYLLRDITDCVGLINNEGIGSPIRRLRFRSLRQVREAHDEFVARINTSGAFVPSNRRLPRPPIAGTSTIVPLTTPALLADEGHEQENCVASYVESVAKGRCYVYRILAPERATLAIVPNSATRRWTLRELKAKHNRPIGVTTYETVSRWLNEAQANARPKFPDDDPGSPTDTDTSP
jgi:hypothetical protein